MVPIAGGSKGGIPGNPSEVAGNGAGKALVRSGAGWKDNGFGTDGRMVISASDSGMSFKAVAKISFDCVLVVSSILRIDSCMAALLDNMAMAVGLVVLVGMVVGLVVSM